MIINFKMLNFDNSSESSDKFFVQSRSDENAEFINRQKSVFEQLDAVVRDTEKTIDVPNTLKRHRDTHEINPHRPKKQRYDTRQFRGQESIFKRPEAPPPSRFNRNIPDYRRHPENWTKYTLCDVSQEDMSEQSNTAAAMSFLRELKSKKESETMDVDSEVKQITFRKPSNYIKPETKASIIVQCESPSFRSSKVVMPEYVVGEKRSLKKNVQKLTNTTQKHTEIKLDHLEEGEDED